MGATVSHVLSMTSPNDPAYENQPKHWNSLHAVSFDASIGTNTANSNVTWTVNSSGLSLDARGYAGTGTAATGASVTLNSGGISINLPAYLTTADLSANSSNYVRNWKLTGNSAGTQSTAAGTDLWLAGGQGITLSGSSNSISFSVGSYITTADLSANSSNYARNWKLTGNSAGTQSSAIGTDLWLAGGQGITLSGSSNSISFSVGSYITTGRASTDAIGLNTAQTNVTWTVNSSGLSLNAGGYAGTGFSGTNISGTHNSNGIQLSVAAGGGTTISSYENMPFFTSTALAIGTGSSSIAVAFQLPQPGSFSFLRFMVSNQVPGSTTLATSNASANASYEGTTTWNAVVYSVGTGASSTLLTAVASGSNSWFNRASISVSGGGTQYSATQQFTYAVQGNVTSTSTQYSVSQTNYDVSTTLLTNYTNLRYVDINFANSLSAGPYWLLLGASTSSATNSAGFGNLSRVNVTFTQFIMASQNDKSIGIMGSTDRTSNGFGAGVFSTAGGGTTANFPLSAISTTASNPRLYFQLLRSA